MPAALPFEPTSAPADPPFLLNPHTFHQDVTASMRAPVATDPLGIATSDVNANRVGRSALNTTFAMLMRRLQQNPWLELATTVTNSRVSCSGTRELLS